jgi:hypothetical protein
MKADEMVDAALSGLDQGELITIPSLPYMANMQAYGAARQKLMPNLSLKTPAARYREAPRLRRQPSRHVSNVAERQDECFVGTDQRYARHRRCRDQTSM